MSDMADAFNAIDTQLTTVLQPLIDEDKISSIIFGTKLHSVPEFPFLQIVYDKATCNNTTFGDRETWKQPIKIGSTVKEVDDPQTGFKTARNLIAEARNLLLEDRQFNIPQIVRTVNSTEIITVPFAFSLGTNKNVLYGAGTTLEVLFFITND